ncbi:hypothetical protein NG792_27210, partial [Laspinema sp. C3]|nr:hypothetical protein [Laspinema sp. D3b]
YAVFSKRSGKSAITGHRLKSSKTFYSSIKLFCKRSIESATVGRADNFKKFGLTDCGIIEVSRDKYLVLTDDFKLANYLQKIGIDTINFNNLRGLWE